MNHTAKPPRPVSLTILAALIMVASLVVLLVVIPPLVSPRMEPIINSADGQMPLLMLLHAIAWMAAAVGLWKMQEWGRLLAISLSVLVILEALFTGASQTVGRVLLQIFIHVAIIVFLMQPRIYNLFAKARQDKGQSLLN